MAAMYVKNGASNTSPYDTWAKAAVIIDTAKDAQAAGETVFIASDHDEAPGATQDWSSPNGTHAAPLKFISADRTSGEPPTVQESMMDGGGSFNLTGGSYHLSLNGNDIWMGCHFLVGNDFLMQGEDKITKLINCKVEVVDETNIVRSGGDTAVIWENVEFVQLGGGNIDMTGGGFIWNGGSFTLDGGSITELITMSTTRFCKALIENVDFSGITDGGDYLVAGGSWGGQISFKRCKLSATFGGAMSSAITNSAARVDLISCSSADVTHDIEGYRAEGTVVDETGIYLDGKINGVDACLKLVTTAYSEEWVRPLKYLLGTFNSTADPTVTVELVVDDAAAWNNDDIWLEIVAPDGTVAAFGKTTWTRPATVLTTPSVLTSSSESWTGTGGFGNEQKRKIVQALSGGGAGIHSVYICMGKPSATAYVNSVEVS